MFHEECWTSMLNKCDIPIMSSFVTINHMILRSMRRSTGTACGFLAFRGAKKRWHSLLRRSQKAMAQPASAGPASDGTAHFDGANPHLQKRWHSPFSTGPKIDGIACSGGANSTAQTALQWQLLFNRPTGSRISVSVCVRCGCCVCCVCASCV